MSETAKPVHRTETTIQCTSCNGMGQVRPIYAEQRGISSAGFVECSACFGTGTIVVVDEVSI